MNNNQYEFTGTILSISQEKQINDKFRKIDVVIRDESADYPQPLQFEFHNDNCNKLASYKTGSLVNVSFNIKGRQNKDNAAGELRTYNNLVAWKIASVAVNK